MNPKHLMIAALLLAFLTFLTAGAAGANEPAETDVPNDNRWTIGFDLVGSNIGDDDDGDGVFIEEEGGGGAVQFGYLFSPNFQLRVYAGGTLHETNVEDVEIAFGGGLIEAVYLFRAGEALRPYVFGGLGGFAAESQQDAFTYSMEGPGASFGGGLHYFFTPHVSLHSSLRVEAVNWETAKVSAGAVEIEVPIDESGSVAKFTFGLGFWF